MVIKCNLSFVFKALRRGANRSFHVVPYFSIQVNKKLNIMVQFPPPFFFLFFFFFVLFLCVCVWMEHGKNGEKGSENRIENEWLKEMKG